MPFLSGLPALQPLPPLPRWRGTSDVFYDGMRDHYMIPSGFTTDLASIPKPFRWLLDDDDPAYMIAAYLHDWLCAIAEQRVPLPLRSHLDLYVGHQRVNAPLRRRDADGVFYRVLGEQGVPPLTRDLLWSGVRVGSRLSGGLLPAEALRLARTLPAGLVVAGVTVPLLGVRSAVHYADAVASDRERVTAWPTRA